MISGWWFGTFFIFHNIYGIIIPIDYFSEELKPPIRYSMDRAFSPW
jgi:hypothetical protein